MVESDYEVASSAEWSALLRHFAFQEGFAVVVILVPDRAGADACRKALALELAERGRSLLDRSPGTARDMQRMAGTLVDLRPGPEVGAVWVAAPVAESSPSFEDWKAAVGEGFAQIGRAHV